MTDQQYDSLPKVIKHIVDTYNPDLDNLEEARRINKELNMVKWGCDYNFLGEIYDVKESSFDRIEKVAILKDIQLVLNPDTNLATFFCLLAGYKDEQLDDFFNSKTELFNIYLYNNC